MSGSNLKKQLQSLHSAVVVDSAWKEQKRNFLVASMNAQGSETLSLFTLFKRQGMLAVRPLASFALVLVFAFGGVMTTVLAASSKPGDMLYAVKLTQEKIQLSMTRDENKKIDLELANAKKRIEEIKILTKMTVSSSKKKEIMQKPLEEYKKSMKKVATATKSADKAQANKVAKTLKDASTDVQVSIASLGQVDDEVAQSLKEVQLTTAEVKMEAVVAIAKTTEDTEEAKAVLTEMLADQTSKIADEVAPTVEAVTTEEPTITSLASDVTTETTEPVVNQEITESTTQEITEPAPSISNPLSTLSTEVIAEAEKLIEAGDIEKALETIETNTIIVETENTETTEVPVEGELDN